MEGARGKEQIGVDVAQHRNDHDRADGGIAKSPKNAIGNGAQDKVVASNFVHGEAKQRHEIQHGTNPHDGKHAAENDAGNVSAGLTHLFTEINDTVPAVAAEDVA